MMDWEKAIENWFGGRQEENGISDHCLRESLIDLETSGEPVALYTPSIKKLYRFIEQLLGLQSGWRSL